MIQENEHFSYITLESIHMTYMKQINQTKNLTITIDMKQQKQNAGFYVNFICETSVPRAKPLDKIKSAALMDKTIQRAIEFTRNGQWHKINRIQADEDNDMVELSTLRSLRDELTVHTDKTLLRSNRIVIPRNIWNRAIGIAHEGHQGITKTK